MKAIQINTFGGNEVLEYVDLPMPKIKDDEVLIKVFATSVNYADIKTRNGKYHAAGIPPLILGMEVVGEVVDIGKDVLSIKKAMPVMAFTLHGSYAQYAVAKSNLTFPLPNKEHIQKFYGAPLVAFTSYKLIKDVAQLKAGQTIVIHGAAGGIGTTAIQIAKAFGAKKIIGTVSSDKKKETAYNVGADAVFLLGDPEIEMKIKKEVGNDGVDIILDSYAGEVTENGLNYLAPFGKLVIFGDATQKTPNIDIRILQSSCRSILGYSLGTVRNIRPSDIAENAEEIIRLIDEDLLKIQVHRVFPLSDASKAIAFLESRQSMGKIVLEIGNHED